MPSKISLILKCVVIGLAAVIIAMVGIWSNNCLNHFGGHDLYALFHQVGIAGIALIVMIAILIQEEMQDPHEKIIVGALAVLCLLFGLWSLIVVIRADTGHACGPIITAFSLGIGAILLADMILLIKG